MFDVIINNIIQNYSYITLFMLCFGYFLFLYFALAPLFLAMCKLLERKNILHKIEEKEVTKQQLQFEIKHSVKSIVIFGFSIIPVIFLIREGVVALLPNTFLNIVVGVAVLTLWNEIHFFVVHRIMHLPFFMKRVHYIHHKSKVPTVYSVYSFHWLEALLLSTVPLTIIPLIPFSPIAIFVYPLASILLNYSGHCNFRFGKGEGESWKLFGTHHNQHHFRGRKNYGFASNLLDKLSSKFKK